MMRIFRYVLPLATLLALQITFAHAAEQTDLLLVLAMDVSRSMDQAKFLLQRQGYAVAISNPQVLNAIKSGPHQKIALCFIDWSGPFEQKLVIDWTIIDGPAAASRFGDLVAQARRPFYSSTSIGAAINFATVQLARAPFDAERRAIDVSGDGTNNAGPEVQFFRDQAVAKGIIVNGLVILTAIELAPNLRHTNPPGGIEKYYRDNVIGGAGSFAMVAEDYNSFGRAMVRKLIAEIATRPEQPRLVSTMNGQARTTSNSSSEPRTLSAQARIGIPARSDAEE
jgi:Protein of unknown function (DUF1194)